MLTRYFASTLTDQAQQPSSVFAATRLTVKPMDEFRIPVRPLADRVVGIDNVLIGLPPGSMSAHEVVSVRFAAADYVRRHGEVLDRIEAGEEPIWLVTDQLLLEWPDDAVIEGGMVLYGAELLPVAAAVLHNAPDPAAVASGSAKAHALLRAQLEHHDEWEDDEEPAFAATVTLEILDSFVIASLDATAG